ncbi:ester cyclase [Kosakonia sp. WA-90]|uniref:ester cyclase n=1 Tax=Kosakonia sp. WA-90 TaxID=3153576 RepID=UPI00325D878C
MQRPQYYLTRAAVMVCLPLSYAAHAADEALIQPAQLIVDQEMAQPQLMDVETAARRYATFWNTGDETLARKALAADFIDKTPPEGRKQGPEGAILASRGFRTAVPDLRCEVEQMIIAGNRVVSHLHFRGHFTGTFGKLKGKGQTVDFIATDIYQVEKGKITANWHIEDNLTLMKQLGAL